MTRRKTMSLMTFDRQELNRFARTFEDLFYRADAATMATFYAEDAEVMALDSDPIRGRHAITAFFAAACQAAQRLGMKRTITVRRVETLRRPRLPAEDRRRGTPGYQRHNRHYNLQRRDGLETRR
jgi:hypothetical protein